MLTAPLDYGWWLAARSAGIVALLLVTASVLLGLAMAARVLPRGVAAKARGLHEQLAVTGLVAIAAHGIALFMDPWLKPGVLGLTVPFAFPQARVFTALGIVAAYLAVVLGLSFYARRRIGARRWRTAHRATVLVWLFGAVHALGAGSDGGTRWLAAVVLLPALAIVPLVLVRLGLLPTPARTRAGRSERRPVSPAGGGAP